MTLDVRAAAGVLANDYDRERDGLTAAVVAGPQHGTLTLRADGSFEYAPAAGYSGPDAFVYKVTDRSGKSSTATAAIEVLNWTDQVVGDFNGDGRKERAGRDAAGNWEVAVATGDHFVVREWGPWTRDVTWSDVRVGDFDGDGRDDIAARHRGGTGVAATGAWHLALSTGTGFAAAAWEGGGWSPSATWSDVRVGDFDGDGRDDLAGRISGEWWVTRSTGSRFRTTKWGVWSTAVTWRDVLVGDFDGDGRADLAGRNGATGWWSVAVSTYLPAGGPQATTDWGFATAAWGPAWNAAVNWSEVFAADVDGDGRTDLVGRDPGTTDWWVSRSIPSGTGGAWETRNYGNYFTRQAAAYVRQTTPGVKALDHRLLLDAALRTFEWVRNNVRTEFYRGLMKGPQAVRETMAGNAWDQAALLVDLLQQAGVEARIATGTIRASKAAARDWTGAVNDTGVNQLLNWAGLYVGTDPENFLLSHAWVQAKLPGAGGLDWRDLDPSWKSLDRREGVPDILANLPFTGEAEATYLSKPWEQLPYEFYEDRVAAHLRAVHPGLSLADVPRTGPIVPRTFDVVPGGFGYTVVGAPVDRGDFVAVLRNAAHRNELTHRVRLALLDAGGAAFWQYEFTVPEVSLGRISIVFEGLETVTPYLRLDGRWIDPGVPLRAVPLDSAVTLVIDHLDPGVTTPPPAAQQRYTRKAGESFAVGLDALQFSE
ncbi:MAG TPA: FG-GAP-like repeat-containing protein, partial [Planctomycetaceae bacterium]